MLTGGSGRRAEGSGGSGRGRCWRERWIKGVRGGGGSGRGGTGGGTEITVLGAGFASKGNKVTIDGSVCDIDTESSTEITCYTNYHAGAIETSVVVEVPGQGYARPADEAAAAKKEEIEAFKYEAELKKT